MPSGGVPGSVAHPMQKPCVVVIAAAFAIACQSSPPAVDASVDASPTDSVDASPMDSVDAAPRPTLRAAVRPNPNMAVGALLDVEVPAGADSVRVDYGDDARYGVTTPSIPVGVGATT